MVAAEGSELLRLPLRIFHVVVRESPSALACSSSAMRPARRSATSTSLSLIERLAFAAAMASPISLIFAVCRPRAGRREVRSGGRGPPFERRPGMQSSQHIQSALMLRLSLRPVGFVLPKLAALAAEFCPHLRHSRSSSTLCSVSGRASRRLGFIEMPSLFRSVMAGLRACRG